MDKFESWGVVDLFGHTRLAGLVSEANIGGQAFVRVDVPAVRDRPAFTRFFGSGAIYGISVVSEEVARAVAGSVGHRPVTAYEIPDLRREDLLPDGERDPFEDYPDPDGA